MFEVLKKINNSEYAALTFIILQKTGDIQLLTDFRKLNFQIVRKPYPLPKTLNILMKLSGFKYARAIDLSMGYWRMFYYVTIGQVSVH